MVGKNAETAAILRQLGNTAFARNDFCEALIQYSRSIAIAPWDGNTTGLALAFANRSAVHISQDNYEACLIDIEQAIKANYPARLTHKLLKRGAECYRAMGNIPLARKVYEKAVSWCLEEDKKRSMEQELAALQPPEQVYKPRLRVRPPPEKYLGDNPMIPGASACIEIKYNENYGRHLVATQDIPPGAVLLVEEPYAGVMQASALDDYCFHCMRWFNAMTPCRSCTLAMYCSESCRNASWQQSHEFECPLLGPLFAHEVDTPIFGALRMFSVALKKHGGLRELREQISHLDTEDFDGIDGCDADGRYDPTHLRAVNSLAPLDDIYFKDHSLFSGEQHAHLVDVISTGTELFHEQPKGMKLYVDKLLKRYLKIFCRNSYSISGYQLTESAAEEIVDVGSGLFAVGSLLNHSCLPNCHSYNRGSTTVFVSSYPIARGEQVFVSYNEDNMRETGCGDLELWYSFQCTCHVCTDPVAAYSDWPLCPRCKAVVHIKTGQENAKCKRCNNHFNVTRITSACLSIIDSIEKLVFGPRCEEAAVETSRLIAKLSLATTMSCDVVSSLQECLMVHARQAGLYYFNNEGDVE